MSRKSIFNKLVTHLKWGKTKDELEKRTHKDLGSNAQKDLEEEQGVKYKVAEEDIPLGWRVVYRGKGWNNDGFEFYGVCLDPSLCERETVWADKCHFETPCYSTGNPDFHYWEFIPPTREEFINLTGGLFVEYPPARCVKPESMSELIGYCRTRKHICYEELSDKLGVDEGSLIGHDVNLPTECLGELAKLAGVSLRYVSRLNSPYSDLEIKLDAILKDVAPTLSSDK